MDLGPTEGFVKEYAEWCKKPLAILNRQGGIEQIDAVLSLREMEVITTDEAMEKITKAYKTWY